MEVGNCVKCQQVQTTKGTRALFLKSVSVWINKPHVANRRLCGSKIVKISHFQTRNELNDSLSLNAACLRTYFTGNDDILDFDGSGRGHTDCVFKDLAEERDPFTLIYRELIPKSEFFPKLLEAVVYDKERATVAFIPVCQEECRSENESSGLRPTHELKYSVQFMQMKEDFPAWAQINEIALSWSCDHNETESEVRRQITSKWLCSTLLDKLVSWSHVNDISTSVTSLQLVAVDKYKDTYVQLKKTYGKELVQNWTERTDPKKFVYEDIAIAAYLLLIWEEDRKKKNLTEKQSFVDLGCGNGLLVYILTKEGHKGLGIDLRKRNIWDTFGEGIDLREDTIKPSTDNLFPDYDWIIGNHSDELTPWIPVIAARSSYRCSFFVLPCCHYDFVGKFGLTEKGRSVYSSYLNYVENVIYNCGFYPESDTLRIPSTKRICFIGRGRSYMEVNEKKVDTDRQAFIDRRMNHIRSVISKKKRGLCKQDAKSVLVPHLPSSSAPSSEDDSGEKLALLSRLPSDEGYVSGLSSIDSLDGAMDCMDRLVELQKRKLAEENRGQLSAEPSDVTARKQRRNEDSVSESRKVERPVSHECHLPQYDEDRLLKKWNIVLKNELPSIRSQQSPEALTVERKNELPAVGSQLWTKDFTPREEQGVRNCQRVAEVTKLKIVQTVFDFVMAAEDQEVATLEGNQTWRKGGKVPLGKVVQLFDKSTLQELKSECGGLQTLLRNHSHVFKVTGGVVQLRDFTLADAWEGCNPHKVRGKQKETYKTTLCWFSDHHPDGCPRRASGCLFAHGASELRKKQIKAR